MSSKRNNPSSKLARLRRKRDAEANERAEKKAAEKAAAEKRRKAQALALEMAMIGKK